MKLNYETCLVGEKVILVPYRKEHVNRYHEWMKDPALLEATDSEPLSLEEEFDMQQSWRDDPNKCTFIVHATEMCSHDETEAEFSITSNLPAMVGDVNMFLSEIDDEIDELKTDGETKSRIQGEIDIMIAEKSVRKKGLGRAATCSMLLYGLVNLNVERFFCKINEDNTASIQLFKSIGFVQCDYAACFKQIEMELVKPKEELRVELGICGSYKTIPCPVNEK